MSNSGPQGCAIHRVVTDCGYRGEGLPVRVVSVGLWPCFVTPGVLLFYINGVFVTVYVNHESHSPQFSSSSETQSRNQIGDPISSCEWVVRMTGRYCCGHCRGSASQARASVGGKTSSGEEKAAAVRMRSPSQTWGGFSARRSRSPCTGVRTWCKLAPW